MRTNLVIALAILIQGEMTGSSQRPRLNERVTRLCQVYATRYALKERISPAWVHAIIGVESNWNPAALSTKGAMGLMQLMPATAKRFRVRNPFNIEQNIRGGVEYLSYLFQYFGGDLRLATAAYCAGEERIRRRGLSYCNREVYVYVANVAKIYRQSKTSQGATP